jgi:uncharacterized protein (TIRG00374 family)
MGDEAGGVGRGRARADPDDGTEVSAEPPAARSKMLRLVRIGVVVVVLLLAVVVLRDQVPSPATIMSALAKANWWWVAAALVLQLVSLSLQIRQQRRLLGAFGVAVSLPRVGAITYSSTALSMSMPVGGAVSAGYTYRQYRANGASPATAATVLLLSGLASMTALIAVTAAGAGASGLRRALGVRHQQVWTLVGVAVALGAIVELLVLLLRWWSRRKPRPTGLTAKVVAFGDRHPKIRPILEQVTLTGHQASHLSSHHWRLVLLMSAGNWALDAACLYASCEAFAIHISVINLGAVYIGVQLIRQIPLTPGGIGVMEASLLAGLLAAHAAKGPAAASVLIYRLFSAWLIVPIGFVLLAVLRRTGPKRPFKHSRADSTADKNRDEYAEGTRGFANASREDGVPSP